MPQVPTLPMSPDDLTDLLERCRLQAAGGKSPDEVTQGELDLLLARIDLLTSALRAAEANETARLATRLLLLDVGLVAAQLRGRVNVLRDSLTGASEAFTVALAAMPPDEGDPT
jgi:hypothetical protein